VEGIKNRSDKHLQESYRADPASDLGSLGHSRSLPALFSLSIRPDRLSQASKTGTNLVRAVFKTQPEQDSYLYLCVYREELQLLCLTLNKSQKMNSVSSRVHL